MEDRMESKICLVKFKQDNKNKGGLNGILITIVRIEEVSLDK